MNRIPGWVCAALATVAMTGCDGDDDSMPTTMGGDTAFVRTVEVADVADSDMLVLDVREREMYMQGHIEGARWLDPSSLRATVDGIEGQAPDLGTAAQVFGEAGLGIDDEVVVVGADNGTDPARVVWSLRYYGHQGSVSLLDGGVQAWVADGQPLQQGDASPATAYTSAGIDDSVRVDKAWMLDHLDDPDVAIFDVRSVEEFNEGHIPGAVHVEWTRNLGADGGFLPPAEVRGLHADPSAPTLVVYCRTGSRASVSWVLLRENYGDVRLYDGSWAEWGSDPDTPKE